MTEKSITQIASINGDEPEEDVDELLDDIPIAALDNVDLELPTEYEDEIFAIQVLNAVTNYHTCEPPNSKKS